jgi:hypothetical protein
MRYPYGRSYRGSGLEIKIRADRKYFITALENILLFPAGPKPNKPSLKITLCLFSKKPAFIGKDPGEIPFYKACSIDAGKREALIWVPQAYQDRRIVDDNQIFIAPLNTLLNFLGYYAIHASLVYKNEVFIAFAGPGGCGKSTLSCMLSLNGFKLLCDDMVFISNTGKSLDLIPLKMRVKVKNRERKSFIDEKKIFLRDMPDFPRVKDLFFIFPRYCENERPKLKPISRKEGIWHLISDNMVMETGHPDRKTGQINLLDFICGLRDKASFFELSYNDSNLIEAAQAVRKLCA